MAIKVYIDIKGEVVAALPEFDSKHSKTNTAAGGEKMGETKCWDEFINPDYFKIDKNARILFGESWQPSVNKVIAAAKNMNLKEIGALSTGSSDYDIKTKWEYAPFGLSTGRLLDEKYATARSAGNYIAGYLAATHTMYVFSISKYLYHGVTGALQVKKWDGRNIPIAIGILAGTRHGLAPYYGEILYSDRMISAGFDAGAAFADMFRHD